MENVITLDTKGVKEVISVNGTYFLCRHYYNEYVVFGIDNAYHWNIGDLSKGAKFSSKDAATYALSKLERVEQVGGLVDLIETILNN